MLQFSGSSLTGDVRLAGVADRRSAWSPGSRASTGTTVGSGSRSGCSCSSSAEMSAVARPYYQRLKEAIEVRPPVFPRRSDEELEEILRSPVAVWNAVVGARRARGDHLADDLQAVPGHLTASPAPRGRSAFERALRRTGTTSPVGANRDPWQGQAQVVLGRRLHLTVQPSVRALGRERRDVAVRVAVDGDLVVGRLRRCRPRPARSPTGSARPSGPPERRTRRCSATSRGTEPSRAAFAPVIPRLPITTRSNAVAATASTISSDGSPDADLDRGGHAGLRADRRHGVLQDELPGLRDGRRTAASPRPPAAGQRVALAGRAIGRGRAVGRDQDPAGTAERSCGRSLARRDAGEQDVAGGVRHDPARHAPEQRSDATGRCCRSR